jgi:hypothetical protein
VEACHVCGEITISGIYEVPDEEPKFFRKRVKRGLGLVEEYGLED